MSDEQKPVLKMTKIGDGTALFAKLVAGLAQSRMNQMLDDADREIEKMLDSIPRK